MNRVLLATLLIAVSLSCTLPAHSQAPAPSAATLPQISMVNIYVTDFGRSERFYQQVFGLSAPHAYNPREHVFTLAEQPGQRIELVLTDKPHPNGLFSMTVADAEAVVSRTPAAGGVVVQPAGPPMGNYGYRLAVVTDPDGMTIKILQAVTRP